MPEPKRRPLSEIEQKVLDYIKEHPNRNAYDIALNFDHSEEAYTAIAFLTFNLYARVDVRTGAITVYE